MVTEGVKHSMNPFDEIALEEVGVGGGGCGRRWVWEEGRNNALVSSYVQRVSCVVYVALGASQAIMTTVSLSIKPTTVRRRTQYPRSW